MDRSNLFLLHIIVWVKLSGLLNTALLQDSRGLYRGGEHPYSHGWRKWGTQRLTTLPPVLHQLHWQETKGRIQTFSHFLLISSDITWPCRQTKLCPELQPWLELQKANQHAKGKVSARLGAPLSPLTTMEPCHQVKQEHHKSFSPLICDQSHISRWTNKPRESPMYPSQAYWLPQMSILLRSVSTANKLLESLTKVQTSCLISKGKDRNLNMILS